MNMQVGEYIGLLINKKGYKPSEVAREIGVPRQLLSYVISGKRETSISLALKLESFFSLREGKLLQLQTGESIRNHKNHLKQNLIDKLIKSNAFWSYENISPEIISDEILIEKTFEVLDLIDISKLFELYSRAFIKKVWKERMAIQGDYLLQLNIFIALYYFGIQQPEKYLNQIEQAHIKKITSHA